MEQERRRSTLQDRRANPRSGRREADGQKPWYMRRRLWLAAASVIYVGWRKLRALGRATDRRDTNIAA
jgi:hypothetical protein